MIASTSCGLAWHRVTRDALEFQQKEATDTLSTVQNYCETEDMQQDRHVVLTEIDEQIGASSVISSLKTNIVHIVRLTRLGESYRVRHDAMSTEEWQAEFL